MLSLPATLDVEYIGLKTLPVLCSCFDNADNLPFAYSDIPISSVGKFRIAVEAADLNPKGRGLNLEYPTSDCVVARLGQRKQRALNIPETLALARLFTKKNLAALGQPIRRPFGLYVVCVVTGGLILLPYNRHWGDSWAVGATTAENPLV